MQGVLREDPHRESAWRLSMRIAGALGQEDRVIARFRDCRAALAEVATVAGGFHAPAARAAAPLARWENLQPARRGSGDGAAAGATMAR